MDSSTLSDLSKLLSDGLHKSDVVVLLATKGVLTRPWCLLELLEAAQHRIPVVHLQLAKGGFSFEEAYYLLDHFEEEMEFLNPTGLAFLRQRLGEDLTAMTSALTRLFMLNQSEAIVFDSHASNHAMVATMKDVVEKMAQVSGRTIQWVGRPVQKHKPCKHGKAHKMGGFKVGSLVDSSKSRYVEAEDSPVSSPASQRNSHTHASKRTDCAIIISCASGDPARMDARVLCAELSAHIGRTCLVSETGNMASSIRSSKLLVILLTKHLLGDPRVLFEIYTALQNEVPIVPVAITGAGYDYDTASHFFSHLEAELPTDSASYLLQRMGGDATLRTLGQKLYHRLTSLIACSWSPQSSKNQLEAVVEEIIERMNAQEFMNRGRVLRSRSWQNYMRHSDNFDSNHKRSNGSAEDTSMSEVHAPESADSSRRSASPDGTNITPPSRVRSAILGARSVTPPLGGRSANPGSRSVTPSRWRSAIQGARSVTPPLRGTCASPGARSPFAGRISSAPAPGSRNGSPTSWIRSSTRSPCGFRVAVISRTAAERRSARFKPKKVFSSRAKLDVSLDQDGDSSGL